MDANLSRRNLLKFSGATAGALVAGSAGAVVAGGDSAAHAVARPAVAAGEPPASGRYTWFANLGPFYPGTESLASDEMRVTFLGTCGYIPRLSGVASSIFVELGNGDSFVFDCGSGVVAKYAAMKIPYSRMSKIFLTHLHGDHVSDLTTIYTFGPAGDRKFPLYVWGPSRSEVRDPVTGKRHDDGTRAFCGLLRETLRWHTEAFSFLNTAYTGFKPPHYAPKNLRDGYDLVPFELNWRKGAKVSRPAVAYQEHGVKITHFPAVHDRQGSISYKLEWNGLSLIFSGDTKPSQYMIDQADQGVDLLIHEVHEPAETTVWESGGRPDQPGWTHAVEGAQMVIDNSHTPQKALGYLLAQLKVPPRLTVATHFPAEDDTVVGPMPDGAGDPALPDINLWFPTTNPDTGEEQVVVAADLLVLNVTQSGITKRQGIVSDYAWVPPGMAYDPATLVEPKYHNADGSGDPYAQLDPHAPVIDPDLYNAR